MVCVGIDVAKDKHDCCILDSDGTIRADCITIPNNMDGFKQLLQTIRDCTKKSDKIKVGLEISVLNGGEPVCDHNDRLALDQPFKGFLDLLLVLRVSVGGGLI